MEDHVKAAKNSIYICSHCLQCLASSLCLRYVADEDNLEDQRMAVLRAMSLLVWANRKLSQMWSDVEEELNSVGLQHLFVGELPHYEVMCASEDNS